MSRVGRVARAQMKKLLDLLSEDGVLENGKVTYRGTNRKNFWKRIATHLNNVNDGVYKNTLQWCKMWADWKNKTKTKADILLRRTKNKTAHRTLRMSDLELKLLKVIKYPFNNSTDTFQLEMIVDRTNEADNTGGELQRLDFITGDFTYGNDKKDNEGTEYCIENSNRDFCSGDDVLHDDNEFGESSSGAERKESVKLKDDNEIGEFSSGTDQKEKVRLKGKLSKRKISLEAYKIKMKMVLEQEKVQQKTEELRLKALELKVKRDELRVKEMEMNKINYLTNIEEEKLKCLRDISSSLRELLERSKSSNFRYSNML